MQWLARPFLINEAFQGVLPTDEMISKCGDNLFPKHQQSTGTVTQRATFCHSNGDEIVNDTVRKKTAETRALITQLTKWHKGQRSSFLESPETFQAHFGWHSSLCIFKTKASRGTKLWSYFNFYSLYSIWKDQLHRISESKFYEWLFGPEKFSELSRNVPQNPLLECFTNGYKLTISNKLYVPICY